MDQDKFKLLERKGVMPYGYLDSLKKLKEKALPPQQTFYSQMSKENVSDAYYKHAVDVWNEFGIKTIGN